MERLATKASLDRWGKIDASDRRRIKENGEQNGGRVVESSVDQYVGRYVAGRLNQPRLSTCEAINCQERN